MQTIKAAELVLDFDMYPRNNIDAHNVRCIQEAKAAGVEMPPVIADRKTKRVVDGFHRVKAELKDNPDGTISVIFKTYKNDAELFLDSMRYNAAHGARLDPCDRTRCILIAEKLSIPMDAVAGALHMPEGRLGELRETRTATTSGGLSIPIKRTFQHMAGHRFTKAQCEANNRSSGMNQVFYVNQVIDLIGTNLLDKSNGKLLERLQALHKLLDEMFAVA